MRIEEILGVEIGKPFNIVGQNYSNPYILTYSNHIMILKSITTGEEIHSWILLRIINGDAKIENI